MPNQDRGHRSAGISPPATEHHLATLDRLTEAWKRANAALRESERRYRELVESSLGLICTHDPSGRILSINPAAASALGYRPEDGLGRNLRDFLSPDKRHLFDEYLHRVNANGQDNGLMKLMTRSGATRIWMYRNVLSRSPDGSPYILGHAVDITERVEAEHTLRENEHALRAAHDELEVRVKERTTALERAFVEQRDTLTFLTTFSDRLAPVVTFEDLVDVVRKLPVPFLADWTMVHLVNDDGTVRCVPGVHVDAEQQSALASLAGEASGEVSADSHLASVIACGEFAILRSSSEDLPAKLIGPAPAADIFAHLGAGTATMVPLVVDGKVKAVLSLLSGNTERLTPSAELIVEDVARRVRLALDRIQLYREAQEANRLKDEFLSTLSHELRTPLNAIFGWARILRTRELDKSTGHAIQVIERNAEAQVRLIEEILDVSRIITGKMVLAMDQVDVRTIVRATMDTVRPAMQAKRIQFVESIAEDMPPILGDAHRLQQVFWNLLSNALKFTGNEGVITATLRRLDGFVEFEISDTGVGIRRDVLPFVFDRFRQADSSTTRTHGGLGLGLAIVRHIVELHGGSVRAASAGEGRGATFVIQLPAAERQQVRPADAANGNETVDSVLPPLLHGRLILVVEDHDDAREMIAGVLEGAGARVMTAPTTRDAVDRVSHTKPDGLVADLGLPGEDGYSLLNQIRAIYPNLPAIALTAYARASDRDRALAAGFQQHVVKPMDPHELVRILASML